MIQVVEGKIKQYSLPKTGALKDGNAISGYHPLDEETLSCRNESGVDFHFASGKRK